jgi:prepilin-type processing-associated H-X9-DG protein
LARPVHGEVAVTRNGQRIADELRADGGTAGAPTTNLTAVEEAPTQTLVHVAIHSINAPNADPEDFFTPHSGNAMFLFGDGSVRPIRQEVQLSVLQALATRNGGETVSPDDF